MENSKECEDNGGEKTKLEDYHQKLFNETGGYRPLKARYNEMTTSTYNKMKSSNTEPEDMDRYVNEEWDGEDIADLLRNEKSENANMSLENTLEKVYMITNSNKLKPKPYLIFKCPLCDI